MGSCVGSCVADFRDAVTAWACGTGWKVVRALPEKAAVRVFDAAADRIWKQRGAGVLQLERNLARVDRTWSSANLRELSRLGMRSYLRYWQEAFRLPSWPVERIRDGFVLDPAWILDDAVAAGTGAIMVPAHSANWDAAGAWAVVRYGGVTTVAERLKPEALFRKFVAFREAFGAEILPLGSDGVMRTLVRRLEQGRVVALLGDRDISRHGVEVQLMGEPALLPAGPALLAILTGAPLHPVGLRFTENGSRGDVLARIAVPAGLSREETVQVMTQQVADGLAEGIRRAPWDWHMLQPVWTADLDAERIARRRQAAGDTMSGPPS